MPSLVFAGDFAPCRRYERIVLSRGEGVFGDALDVVREADVSFLNLECPLTTATKPIPKSGPALKANPACAAALKSFTVIGMANNHIRDFGDVGVQETVRALSTIGVASVGAGPNIRDASLPCVIDRDGFRVAILAFAEGEFGLASETYWGAASLDVIKNYDAVRAIREDVDFVVVTLHAGNMYFPFPRPGLRRVCQFYIDIGADAVICHHPHVPGAYEYYKDKLIAYSLGNFIFDSPRCDETSGAGLGYLVRLSWTKESSEKYDVTFIPYRQNQSLGGVQLLVGQDHAAFLDLLESYSKVMLDEEAYQRKWSDFIDSRSTEYLARHFSPVWFKGAGILARKTRLVRWLVRRNQVLGRLNWLRCDSHREVLVAALERRARELNLK